MSERVFDIVTNWMGRTKSPEVSKKPEVSEAIKRIQETVETVLYFKKTWGCDSSVEIDIPNYSGMSSWGMTYPKGFVARVKNGEMTMSDIMGAEGSPFANPEAWRMPGTLGVNPAIETAISIVFPSVERILKLSIDDLKKLGKLQHEQYLSKRSEGIEKMNDPFGVLKDEYKHALIENGIDRKFTPLDPEWGAFIYGGLQYESLLKNNSSEFDILVATKIPQVFYQAKFEGNVDTDKGSVRQKLVILPYYSRVTLGWEEWFEETYRREFSNTKNLTQGK